jgi:hypothetical protein
MADWKRLTLHRRGDPLGVDVNLDHVIYMIRHDEKTTTLYFVGSSNEKLEVMETPDEIYGAPRP